jgi:hypothetical protein
MYHQVPPPPPPQGQPNPLDVPVEWYADVPTASLSEIYENISSIQDRFMCSISLVAGGDHRSSWARLVIFGKPLGIHNTLIELKKISIINEVGYTYDAPFPGSDRVPNDDFENVMPVYHAAWTEYYMKRR